MDNINSQIQFQMLIGQRRIPLQQLVQEDKSLPCIPPVQSYTPMTGKLTITIKLDYLNLPFQKNFEFRYSLWGSSQKNYFIANKSELKITASLQMLSKYLWDMNILCVEIVSVLDNREAELTSTGKIRGLAGYNDGLQREKRIVGYAYVSLRKFFINHLMSSFSQEKFVVLDHNKKRLGEIGVDLKIQMLQNNGTKFKDYLNKITTVQQLQPTSQRYTRMQSQTAQLSINQRNTTSNRISYDDPQDTSQSKEKKVGIYLQEKKITSVYGSRDVINQQQETQKQLMGKNFKHKNHLTQRSQRQIINEAEDEDQNQQHFYRDPKKKKSYHQSHIEEISKPEHTDLSLIRMKWGSNHPAVQLMKLRLDEAKYLQTAVSQSQASSQNLKNATKIKLLLKDLNCISGRGSPQPKFLTVYYATGDSKIISRTELNLQNLPKSQQPNVIVLNFLLSLNDISMTDKLIVETVQSNVEILFQDLINNQIIDLRRKDNRKRAYELRYQVIANSDQGQKDRDSAIQSAAKKQSPNKNTSLSKSKQVTTSKTKQINDIINGRKPSQTKDKLPPKKNLKIVPEKENGQQSPPQLSTPYNKLLIESQVNSKRESLPEQLSIQQSLKLAFRYFQLLYRCEDQNCLLIVNKLLSRQKISVSEKKSLYQRLYSLLCQNQPAKIPSLHPLENIINSIFEQSFESFYQCFLSYKDINQKYETVLYKITKLLSLPLEGQFLHDGKRVSFLVKILGIIDYVKKYKKEKINFGLIKMDDLLQIIKKKYSQREINQKIEDQNEQSFRNKSEVNGQPGVLVSNFQEKAKDQQLKLIKGLLKLFAQYERKYIKVSQLQNHILASFDRKINLKQSKQSLQLNLNLGIITNLYQEVVLSREQNDYQKFTSSKLYGLIEKNKEFLHLEIQKEKRDENILTIYDLLFEDPLSLSDLKSSIHFSLQQKEQPYHERVITQPQFTQERLKSEQEQFQQYSMSRWQKLNEEERRLKTQELSGNENKRLNTEDQNIINFMNAKKDIIERKQNEIKNMENFYKKEDQTIGIQITKRQEFHIQKPSKTQYQPNLKDKQQSNQQHSITNQNKAQTNYISFRCSLLNPLRKNKDNFPFKNEQVECLKLFYVCSLNQENKLLSKQFQLQAKSSGSQAKIVPNSFDLTQQGNVAVEQFSFRIQSFPQKSRKSIIFSKVKDNIVKIKNIIGKEQYPIEDSQGKICCVIEVEIQEVDEYEQRKFLSEKGRLLLQQKQKPSSDKYNQMYVLNVNRLFSLDLLELNSDLRLIYQNQNQTILVRDIMVREREDIIQSVHESQQSVEKEKRRVISLNIDNIKIKPLSLSQQKHFLKVFKIDNLVNREAKINQTTTNDQKNRVGQNFTAKNMKSFRPHGSQRVSRSLDKKLQNKFSNINNNKLDLLCQFEFTCQKPIQDSQFGIRKQTKWLVDQKYRLEVELFNIRYEKWTDDHYQGSKRVGDSKDNAQIWDKKIEKILSVFNSQNQSRVRQSFYHQQKQQKITSDLFLSIISDCMQYRLTEKEIFTSLCFASTEEQPKQNLTEQQKLNHLLQLFNLILLVKINLQQLKQNQRSSIKLLSSLYEEFQTFDLQHYGYLTALKYEVVKKVVPELNLLKSQSFTLGTKRFKKQILVDCKITPKQNKKLVDYLKILWECRDIYEDDFFHQKQPIRNENQLILQTKPQTKRQLLPQTRTVNKDSLPKYYRIRVKQFNNLMLNEIPCTLQFQINGKKLFEPIYRCYSHEFQGENSYTVVELNNQKEETFILKVFNRVVSLKRKKQELYEYKLFEKFDIRQILKQAFSQKDSENVKTFQLDCQNLDGKITIEVQCLTSKQQYQYCLKDQKKNREVDLSPQNLQIRSYIIPKSNENKLNVKQIDSYLKKQFYQQSQNQRQRQKQRQRQRQRNVIKSKKQNPFIGSSVINAFNQDQSKYQKYKLTDRLKGGKNQDLLSQTRKQWTEMMQGDISRKQGNQSLQKKQLGAQKKIMQDVLKIQIGKEELQRKFRFQGISSESSDNESDEQ